VNTDRNATRRVVQHAEKRGIKALFITVDAPQLGRREKVMPPFAFALSSCTHSRAQDMRQKYDAEDPAEQTRTGGDVDRTQGAARAISVCHLLYRLASSLRQSDSLSSTPDFVGKTSHGSRA
jgi:L-lactate dehydrogenase (cytochrome)